MIAHIGHVMTLANSIIGVGILAMPFCFQKCGIILSVVLLILSNWITRICCHYLIKPSLLTRRKSFENLGFQAFGSSGKLLVELCIIGYLLGTCITYFVVVGDLGPQIITKMFSLEDGHLHLRTWVMIAVTLVCILPLGMLKNVDSLSTVCTASIGFYICFVIKIILESEEHMLTNDWKEKVLYWEPTGVLQCLPIFGMALSCQMQLFEVFGSINNQSLEKLNGIVRNATWICTFVYLAVGFFGYVAFCTQTFSGNILINFSPSFGSDVIKIGFVLSVAFSFPLVIFPCRASIYSLLYRKGHMDASNYIPETRFKSITVAIVVFALTIALMIPSVELIIGLVGSTIGVAICIMFPAACFRKIVKKESNERALAQFIIIGGFCLMILGTYANLNAIDEKRSGAHLASPIGKLQHEPTEMGLLHRNKFDKLEQQQKIVAQETDLKPNIQGEFEKQGGKGGFPSNNVKKSQALPIIEKHEIVNTILKKVPDKLQVVSPIPEVVKSKSAVQNNQSIIKNAPAKSMVLPKKLEVNATQMQMINKDAIKKEDDVAAEEMKNNKEPTDALEKAKKELKETQKLLERKVDELKEELAKQNKETQNLVAQKLEEVVEKVVQIERKVQNSDARPERANLLNVPSPNPKQIVEDRQKQILFTKIDENKAGVKVYEHLSNEASQRVGNASKQVPQLPLPLPLLINSSQAKMNKSLLDETKPPEYEHDMGKVINLPKPSDEYLKNFALDKANETKGALPQPDNVIGADKEREQPNIVKKTNENLQMNSINNIGDEDKSNVEAIRREILQINPNIMRVTTTIQPQHRVRRSANIDTIDFSAINSKLQQQHSIIEPSINTLMTKSLSGIIDMKIRMGRELKALEDKVEK